MKKIFLIPSILLLTFLGCYNSVNFGLQAAESSEQNSYFEMNQTQVTTEVLTSTEVKGLLLMREEEKMALDVYSLFNEKYDLMIFDHISGSESRHAAAILSLINSYGLTDPATSEPGKFTNPAIQNLYNQLIAAGIDVAGALITGAYIEEYDIADLKKLISETKNNDIKAVYSNLLSGSENHLRAFVRNLKMREIVYERQILSSEDFDIILSGGSIAPASESNGKCGKKC